MSTVGEIETAIEKLSPAEIGELARWFASRYSTMKSSQLLASIDEAEKSLLEEGGVPAEDVRRDLRRWITE